MTALPSWKQPLQRQRSLFFHVVVLDTKHLSEIDKISYTIPGTVNGVSSPAFFSERVVSVMKTTFPIYVEILTQSQTKLLISAGYAEVQFNGVSIPICGAISCANFKVDDPSLDADGLDEKLIQVMGSDWRRRVTAPERRLDSAPERFSFRHCVSCRTRCRIAASANKRRPHL